MNMERSVRVFVAGALVAGLAAFGAACQKKPAEQAAQTLSPAADTAQQQRIAEGQHAFLANCAMCHGEWGEGDGPLAAELKKQSGAAPARLADRARLQKIGRAEVVRVIERGGAHTGRSNLMPPWGERLAPGLIERIADFVMVLPDLSPATPPATIANYLEAPPGVPEQGRKLFVFYCTACHGSFGKGDGTFADSLFARNHIRPRNLTDSLYFSQKTDAELFATVSLGGGHFKKSPFMPAWTVTLTPGQIKDVVSYVRALSRTPSRP